MTNERPTLRQLEYVVAIADEGHFGRAAERCAVSQPALSAQVAELERRLGVTLFERGRHGAVVTPEAAPLVARARRVLAEADDLVREADDRSGEVIGALRLGAIPTMAPYLLPAVVAELRRRQPRAELRLREDRTVDLLARLRDGELDLGLLAGPVDGDDLAVAELAEEAFVLALPEGHDFAGRSPLPASALAGLPVILLEEGHCLRDQALSLCATVGASPLADIQATSLPTLTQLVAGGQGVTLLPASAVAVEARAGVGLTTRPLRAPAPRRTVVLAWRRSSARAAHFAELARHLRAPVRQACRA